MEIGTFIRSIYSMKTLGLLKFSHFLLTFFLLVGCKKKVEETRINSLKVVSGSMPDFGIWSVYGKLTTDGHLLIGGSEMMNGVNTQNLIKVNLNGEVIWTKSLENIWQGFQYSQIMDSGNEGLINEFVPNEYCVINPPKVSVFSTTGSLIHSFSLPEKLDYNLGDAKVNFINGQYHIIARYHSNLGQLLQTSVYDLGWNKISTNEIHFPGYGGLLNCNAEHVYITTRNDPPFSKIYKLNYKLEFVDSIEFKELCSFIGFEQNRFILLRNFSYSKSSNNYVLNFRNSVGQAQELMHWGIGGTLQQVGFAFSRMGNANYLAILMLLHEGNRIETKVLELQAPDYQNFTINTFGDVYAFENLHANSKVVFRHAVSNTSDSLIYFVGQWDESLVLMKMKRTGEIVYWD